MNQSPQYCCNIRRKQFGGDVVLQDVVVGVSAGETVAVLGASGSGKSTLLRIMAGLDMEYEGETVINGEQLMGPARSVGVLFQESRLYPWMNVRRNIAFAIPSSVVTKTAVIDDALEFVGLTRAVSTLLPRELSGGMVKRVAFARAVSGSPSLLLMDEPFAALDAKSRDEFYARLEHSMMGDGGGASAIFRNAAKLVVTHDIEEAVFLSDRIILLSRTRPASVSAEIGVSQARPRNRHAKEFRDVCQTVLDEILR